MRRPRLWPPSLAGRTAWVLLLSLMLVQVAGLTIHALDRIDVIRLAQLRDVAVRAASLYRAVSLSPPGQRAAVVREFDEREDSDARLEAAPPRTGLAPVDPGLLRQLSANLRLVPMPADEQPRQTLWFGGGGAGRLLAAMELPDGGWLNMGMQIPSPRPWHSSNFLLAFALMTGAAAGLTVWAVRRLVAPVATLAAAADRLGRDVNAAPLPEDGPREVATAAAAFNTMAARMRRLLADRTFMLAAISHDLRTPITRLRLRAEFIDDEDQRRKMLADLDELETMVSAALALGRDAAAGEAVSAVDLVELVRTVLDETADAMPEAAERLGYAGPDHLTILARPFALKRALTNLIGNAVKYGDAARVTVAGIAGGVASLTIDDDGPGVPADDLERLFQPFQRLEVSRNRETGGVGLGLTIARNILRAHGGEATLVNRPGGGGRAIVTLPQ